MKKAIRVGDVVEETGTDSGLWVVAEVFPVTRTSPAFSRVTLRGRPDVVAYVNNDRLQHATVR